jgi:hypothetical protein
MSENKKPNKPQGIPKITNKESYIGESKAQQDNLRKAAEIPPRPKSVKPSNKDSK